jgi:hypothetical protein
MAFEIVMALLGVLTGVILFGGLGFFVFLPYYGSLGYFVNKPGGQERSGIHFFTRLEPGQVKIIVRGEKLSRMITNTAGKRFARKGERDSADYWEMVDGATENPVADVWSPLKWWAQLVYDVTGLVFTGIYPFQRVREYELEKTKVKRKEGRDSEPGKSNLELSVETTYSDHYRTREFLFDMHITGAEVKGNIPLDIIGTAELEVQNPYKAAFGTDRWDRKVVNLVTNAINLKTKTMGLDNVLNAENEEEARAIATAAKDIEEDTGVAGINIGGFKLLEINPVLRPEQQDAIQAGAIAEQKAKATRIDGDARADALRKLNEANKAGGDHSVATMEAEALVRASDAAGKGGGTVILMPPGGNKGGGNDGVQAAILAELVRLNANQKGTKE